jgi:hypothetical protein
MSEADGSDWFGDRCGMVRGWLRAETPAGPLLRAHACGPGIAGLDPFLDPYRPCLMRLMRLLDALGVRG